MIKELTPKQILRQRVFEKYDGCCAYCGNKFIHVKVMHMDHIIPRSKGGSNGFENLNPACVQCNNTKKTYSIEEFRECVKTIEGRLSLNYPQIRFCLRLGVIEFKKEVVFHFEKVKAS